jgi:hypothetical protein
VSATAVITDSLIAAVNVRSERRARRVRSSSLIGANQGNRAALGEGQCCEQLGDAAAQIRDVGRVPLASRAANPTP